VLQPIDGRKPLSYRATGWSHGSTGPIWPAALIDPLLEAWLALVERAVNPTASDHDVLPRPGG